MPDYPGYLQITALNEQDFNMTLSTWNLDHIGDYDINFEIGLSDVPSAVP